MRRAVSGLLAAVVGASALTPLLATTSVATPAEDPSVDVTVEVADPVALPRPASGRTALRLLDDQVPAAAALNDLPVAELREILRTDDTAWLSTTGRLYYREPIAPVVETGPTPAASYPLEQTFALHSKPGAQRTIFLDVDGAQVSGTEWHADQPTTPTVHPAWDPAGNGPAFSDAEKATVQAVWERVAEDYAPFDVDVTTQDPGPPAIRRSSAADQAYGAHVVIGPSGAHATLCDSKCGGIAYLGVFDEVTDPGGDGYGYYQPAWVFTQGTGNTAKAVAEAASHEVGHQLGLSHDGNAAQEYDAGRHGWAPIMGLGYYEPISQWSKGDYATATNQEDDVAVIAGVLGERTDEAPPVPAGSPAVPAGAAYVSDRDDVDTYRLGSCTGPVTVAASPTLASGANLDLRLTLLDASGAPLASDDPVSTKVDAATASGLGASVTIPNAAGRYYAAVTGVGRGDWSNGYDDYGSLGAYTVTVTGSCDGQLAPGAPAAPGGLAAGAPGNTSVPVTWSTPSDPGSSAVTGYVLTRTGSDQAVTLGAGATSYDWTGLRPGTSYSFAVTAVNASGSGSPATTTATTTAGVPSAPIGLRATWDEGAKTLDVSWYRPASNGGSPITSFEFWFDGQYAGALSGSASGASFGTVPPGTYTIGVAAKNAVGTGPVAEVQAVALASVPNDHFADRTPLSGGSGAVTGDNAGASAEAGDPYPPSEYQGAGGASVWYSWTAPADGPVTMQTSSTVANRDTTLAAYTGSTLAGLTLVQGNDDVSPTDFLSRITFDAVEGTTYAVAVDGYRNFAAGTGPFTLTWSGTAASTPTTTTLDVVVTGRSVRLSAEVSTAGGVAAGTVQFAEDGTVVDSATVVAGSATVVRTLAPAGVHSYVAHFVPTDPAALAASSSDPQVRTVAPTATSVVLTTSTSGGAITLRAAVAASEGTPAGVVELRDASTLVGTVRPTGGRATLVLTRVAAGTHRYRARFVPDGIDYTASTSLERVVSVPVPVVASRTTLTAPRTAKAGARPTVTVRVLRGTAPATGRVLLRYGARSKVLVLRAGRATFRLPKLRAGTLRLTATYAANATTKASRATGKIVVKKAKRKR